MALYPLTFRPAFKVRPWGGQRLAELYGKALPPATAIGESWEICDRPGDESVVANGAFSGRSLRWLMEQYGRDLVGRDVAAGERFPWLIKLLDARQDLSLQVHPPADRAAQLGGEPKDEVWYFSAPEPDSRIYVGLRRGVTREEFARRMTDGSVARCFHTLATHPGDVMAVPSGRVHSLGRGNVVFEIQENSDTTFRVFDWNRVDADGRPRELHPEASLASIDFSDFEPSLVASSRSPHPAGSYRHLVQFRRFAVDEITVAAAGRIPDERPGGHMSVWGVVSGGLEIRGASEIVRLGPGGFVLLPAALDRVELNSNSPSTLLCVTPSR